MARHPTIIEGKMRQYIPERGRVAKVAMILVQQARIEGRSIRPAYYL